MHNIKRYPDALCARPKNLDPCRCFYPSYLHQELATILQSILKPRKKNFLFFFHPDYFYIDADVLRFYHNNGEKIHIIFLSPFFPCPLWPVQDKNFAGLDSPFSSERTKENLCTNNIIFFSRNIIQYLRIYRNKSYLLFYHYYYFLFFENWWGKNGKNVTTICNIWEWWTLKIGVSGHRASRVEIRVWNRELEAHWYRILIICQRDNIENKLHYKYDNGLINFYEKYCEHTAHRGKIWHIKREYLKIFRWNSNASLTFITISPSGNLVCIDCWLLFSTTFFTFFHPYSYT